jgi:hypothetical protein
MPCKFCHRDEPRCDPEKLILCSRCFQVVARWSQEQIIQAYEFAIEHGYTTKAKVLKTFIQQGDIENGELQNKVRKPTRNIAKHFDRRGDLKADRLNKKSTRRLQKRQRASISEDQQELSAVS